VGSHEPPAVRIEAGRHRLLRVVLLAFLPVLPVLQSCTSAAVPGRPVETPGIAIQGMIIRNELVYPVTDVMINVPATGRFAGCGNILPGTECNTSFEVVDYSSQQLVVSWKEYGQPHQTGAFKVDIPTQLEPSRPAWLEVIIFAMGQAGARLVQK